MAKILDSSTRSKLLFVFIMPPVGSLMQRSILSVPDI
jgi:hypothetical protein